MTDRTATAESTGDALELVVLGAGPSFSVPLPTAGTLAIGRSPDSELRIDHASLSRRHARLACSGREVELEDLGSTNGTAIAGARLAPGAPASFARGQVAELGDVSLVIRRRRPARAAAAAWIETPTLRELDRQLARAAATRLTVLLVGETGVGKDVVAARLHALSPRAARPFVRVNCAALSETLLESELFGHDRGAFSGAHQAKPGLLETADGGTFLLDEIGDLPLGLQPKLLRVLEDREVRRVGAVRPRAIDVRFIAATNRDLDAAVARGAFRADLLHRLDAIQFAIPPLRERRDELPVLAARLAERAAIELGGAFPVIDAAVHAAFARYAWPGNVRELRNVIDRAVALGCGGRLSLEHLPAKVIAAAPAGPPDTLHDELERVERQRIVDALAACRGNQTLAAQQLGLSRTTLIDRIRAYGLPRPRAR